MAKSPPWEADLSTAYPNRDRIYWDDEISEIGCPSGSLNLDLVTSLFT